MSAAEVMADAVMAYWLTGTDDPDMREWWQTDDAISTCHDLIAAQMQAIEDAGYLVVLAGDLPDIVYRELRGWAHQSISRVSAMTDAIVTAIRATDTEGER